MKTRRAVLLSVAAVMAVVLSFAKVHMFQNPIKAATKFSDVPASHWAYDTVQWAIEEGVVTGYPDGTFRPSQKVTEAEFLVMLIRTFDKLPKVTGMRHWADPAYVYATDKNWPVIGKEDFSLRDRPISREQVAEIIAGANGVNFLGADAIQYLLNTGLSKGKTSATVEGYKGADFLTRAEAVQFIKNLKDAGLKELKNRPDQPTPKNEMPKGDAALPEKVKKIETAMEKVVEKSFPNYIVSGREDGVNIYKEKTGAFNLSVSYSVAQTNGGVDRVISFKATEDDSLRLAVKMLQAAGVPVKDDFFDVLKEAAKTGKESSSKVGKYELYVSPHPTNADHLTVYISE